MRSVVRRWGNSAAVRLPASVLSAAGVHLDQAIDVREEAGRIVIEPIQAPAFDLDAMIEKITESNRHDPVDTGPATGHEVW